MWPCYSLFGLFFTFFSSIRSSSVHHGLLHTYKPLFSNCSSLEQSCLCTFIIHFHFYPVFNIYRTEPGNNLAWITLTTHAHTNFFKILQGSSDFSKTQHVLYFLNVWGSMISNMTYAYILHTYWAHLAHILRTPCTHLAHILHTSCTHLVHILHTSCTPLANILRTSCTHPRSCPLPRPSPSLFLKINIEEYTQTRTLFGAILNHSSLNRCRTWQAFLKIMISFMNSPLQ